MRRELPKHRCHFQQEQLDLDYYAKEFLRPFAE